LCHSLTPSTTCLPVVQKPARRKYIAKKYIIAKQLREEMAREAKQKIVEQVQQDTTQDCLKILCQ